ncbi:MAG TPA: Arc family DNA-binding protein [Candidatus Thermoplasmatota archaeon]|jgi:predicted transcriptional regulator|nr:Arc family DNA-binding protein [Candidatus Thermoplasmatota archaeon]
MADTTTVRIPRDIYDSLTLIAKKHHRSINGEASFALEKYVEENRHIVEAAAEAER